MRCQEMKGKVQPPADRKLIAAFSNQVKAKPTGIKQHPNQTIRPKRQYPKEKTRPFFGKIGKGFTFAPTTERQKMYGYGKKCKSMVEETTITQQHPGKSILCSSKYAKLKQSTTIHTRTD